MNQGRIWCVVNPTVGLPLFLGSVAVTSLVVHASVMSHTTWMSDYWQGAKAKTALLDTAAPLASGTVTGSGYTITVTPVASNTSGGQPAFTISVNPADGKLATASAAPSRPVKLATVAQ